MIFAQFPINQFRSIAWYNAAVGVGIIVTQMFLFRGESSCDKLTNNCSSKKNKARHKPKATTPEKSKSSKIITVSVSFQHNYYGQFKKHRVHINSV